MIYFESPSGSLNMSLFADDVVISWQYTDRCHIIIPRVSRNNVSFCHVYLAQNQTTSGGMCRRCTSKHYTICWINVGPTSQAVAQHWDSIFWICSVFWDHYQSPILPQHKPPESTDRIPESTGRRPNVGLMLDHRLWRWPNIIPALGRCLLFTGMGVLAERYRV